MSVDDLKIGCPGFSCQSQAESASRPVVILTAEKLKIILLSWVLQRHLTLLTNVKLGQQDISPFVCGSEYFR